MRIASLLLLSSFPSAGFAAEPAAEPTRDPVGDLKAEAVMRGDFPGSFAVPGSSGVSLAIGGFFKTLAFHDTQAEGREAVFLPALLGGIGRDDVDGTTSLTAELSRINLDVRATDGEDKMRGYVEFDFSGDLFKWRHGYLTWNGPHGDVLAGKSWSTFMDLQAVPDGLGEPTVSGLVFTRQAQFRYGRSLSDEVKFAVAIEDPASNDVLAAEPVLTRTGFPDLIANLNFGTKERHVQVGGILRTLEYDPNGEPGDSENGWGLSLGAHTMLSERDRLYGTFTFGNGLGRYLVGFTPTAGAFIDQTTNDLIIRQNVGGIAGIRHEWSDAARSSLVFGLAEAENDDRQPPEAFHQSSFVLANLLCSVNRYLTAGVELDYGKRENRDGSDLDNLRIMFGMQLF